MARCCLCRAVFCPRRGLSSMRLLVDFYGEACVAIAKGLRNIAKAISERDRSAGCVMHPGAIDGDGMLLCRCVRAIFFFFCVRSSDRSVVAAAVVVVVVTLRLGIPETVLGYHL